MPFWKSKKDKEELKRKKIEKEKKKQKEDDKLMEWLEIEDELDELDKK